MKRRGSQPGNQEITYFCEKCGQKNTFTPTSQHRGQNERIQAVYNHRCKKCGRVTTFEILSD